MDLKDRNVLLFSRTMGQGGAEMVVLQICKALKPFVNKIVVCSSGGVNTAALDSMGVRHYYIADIENKSIFSIFQNLKKLVHVIKHENISIIHTHHRMAALYAQLLRICKPRLIIINTVHNVFTDKKVMTKISYLGTHIVACGKNVQLNLTNFFRVNPESVTIIHNAVEPFREENVDTDFLDELRRSGYKLVGNVGRLSPQKGMAYFIKALPKVLAREKKVKFVIIGDGEEREQLVALSKDLNVSNNVIFLGYRKNVRSIERHLDFIVLSSLWEGLPLTPIEAFSVKKTVIGTDIGGTNEIIEDQKNGLLVEPRNSKDLADKIVYLCKNPNFMSILERNALRTYENNFNFSTFKDSIVNYYRSI